MSEKAQTGSTAPTHAVQIGGSDGTNLKVPFVGSAGDLAGLNNATSPGLLNLSVLYGYNGATYDRIRSSGASSDALGASNQGLYTLGFNYGFNGATWDRLRVDAQKNLLVGLRTSAGVEPSMGAIAADGRGASNNGLMVSATMSGYNNATVDAWRNNTEGTLLASAVRTASTASAIQTNYNAKGVLVVLNVTVASGTGGLQIIIRHKDSVSGVSYGINTTPAAINTTGTYRYLLYPGATSSNCTQNTPAPLPRTWDVLTQHADGSSYTYSVGYALIV